MPIWAAFSEGASLTPSPVDNLAIALVGVDDAQLLVRRDARKYSCGSTRSANSASLSFSSRSPVMISPRSSPACCAIALAVAG
jgi:hypothetical protein